MDAEKLVEGYDKYDYLGRAIAIVTILFERGILQELIDSGRLDPKEVDLKTELIRKKFLDADAAEQAASEEQDDIDADE